MSSETHVEMDWAGTDAPNAATAGVMYLTDEEILGLDPPGPAAPSQTHVILSPPQRAKNPSDDLVDGAENQQRDSSDKERPQDDHYSEAAAQDKGTEPQSTGHESRIASHGMPEWMQSATADPRHGAEAAQLWREHQEFRAAFASPEEARAIKELLPGGVRDVLSLREATQSVERIDAALFSGDARAQAEVVAELARTNPAAFRSLFAEAAKVLAAGGNEARGNEAGVILSEAKNPSEGLAVGIQNQRRDFSSPRRGGAPQNDNAVEAGARAANASSLQSSASDLQHFDPAAYAAFERTTNQAVARDVRGSINDTLARVLPEGVADGAARRIGEDIFHEIHRALAADRTLSEQVAAVLRPPSPDSGYGGQARNSLGGGGGRFGGAEQQRVVSLLAGRAKQLVPSVARRVIGEWTSSVLNTSRTKAARQAAAASRVDIAAPGGSHDSMPLRQMSRREVDYASMSDEEILNS